MGPARGRGRAYIARSHSSPVVVRIDFPDLPTYALAERLARWTQAQNGPRVQVAAATLSGNSLRQTVHTHRASVHQAALVAALLRVANVTASLAEGNVSLPPGLWLTSPAG